MWWGEQRKKQTKTIWQQESAVGEGLTYIFKEYKLYWEQIALPYTSSSKNYPNGNTNIEFTKYLVNKCK